MTHNRHLEMTLGYMVKVVRLRADQARVWMLNRSQCQKDLYQHEVRCLEGRGNYWRAPMDQET